MKTKKITALLSALIVLSSSIPFANATPSIIESEKTSFISKIPDDDRYFSMVIGYDEVYSRAELFYRGFEIIDGNKEMFVYKMPKNMEELDLLIEDYEKWIDTSIGSGDYNGNFIYDGITPEYANNFPVEMTEIGDIFSTPGGGDSRTNPLWYSNYSFITIPNIPDFDAYILSEADIEKELSEYKFLPKYMDWCKENQVLFEESNNIKYFEATSLTDTLTYIYILWQKCAYGRGIL